MVFQPVRSLYSYSGTLAKDLIPHSRRMKTKKGLGYHKSFVVLPTCHVHYCFHLRDLMIERRSFIHGTLIGHLVGSYHGSINTSTEAQEFDNVVKSTKSHVVQSRWHMLQIILHMYSSFIFPWWCTCILGVSSLTSLYTMSSLYMQTCWTI